VTLSATASPTGASAREDLVRLAQSQTPLPSPVEAYFEVANRCNSKCATCPLTFSPQEAARQLSLEEFKALVDQLPDLQRAVLQGIGEPLLNRDLAAMIAHLKVRGVYTVFNTNAALLTCRRQVELIDSGLDELRVSLDSSTPETYLKIRGIPAFDRVVTNLAEMVRTRTSLESSTPRISIWMTALRENLRELPDIVELAARIGVDEVYVQRLVYWGEGLATDDQSIFAATRPSRAHDELSDSLDVDVVSRPSRTKDDLGDSLDADAVTAAARAHDDLAATARPARDLGNSLDVDVASRPSRVHVDLGDSFDPDAILAEAERRALHYGLAFRGADARPPRTALLHHPAEREPWRACSRPLRLAYITAQGTALPCCIAPFTDAPFESFRLGNYLEDGIQAVWQGEAYQRFREQLYSSTPPASCRNCGLAWSL
jgi:MoaA/NifB/PqqE/SkfB family radical SAM enzyme